MLWFLACGVLLVEDTFFQSVAGENFTDPISAQDGDRASRRDSQAKCCMRTDNCLVVLSVAAVE